MGGRLLASTIVLLVNTFFRSDCIRSGRSSHHDVVNFINTYTVAMVSTVMLSICTSPFAVCMKLSSADNLFSGTLLLMPYRSEVVSHPPWHFICERHGQLGTGGDRCLLGISEYFRPLSLYYWRCFVQVQDRHITATGGGAP